MKNKTLYFIFFLCGTLIQSVKDNVQRTVKVPKLPDSAEFCGEKIPMDDDEVRERYEREMLGNVFWESNVIIHLKRMTKHFPQIEKYLKKNNIPDDIKYLCVAESGLSNPVSSAGAAGFWQFMPETAKKYGLEINDEIDERYDFEKSTEAACVYLKTLHNLFGSWTLAAAAYNCGEGSLQRSINVQKENNYFNLYLNQETGRYIFRIIALKEILGNHEKYGYIFSKDEGYNLARTKKINVSGTVDWVEFAQTHKLTYKKLKYYNPWIIRYTLQNKKNKEYEVELPE